MAGIVGIVCGSTMPNTSRINVRRQGVKVYIASGWPFRERIIKINEDFERHGFEITSTWTKNLEGFDSPVDLGIDAQTDTKQIESADAVVAIMDDTVYAYRGTWTEIGFGLGAKKKVVIVCPGLAQSTFSIDGRHVYPYNAMTNVFFWHFGIIRVSTIEEAMMVIQHG